MSELTPITDDTDSKTIRFSSGTNTGVVKERTLEWPVLADRLTKHTITDAKGGGYIVGGYFNGAIRKEEFLLARTLLTFDMDNAQGMHINDVELTLRMSIDCAFVAYSTFSHTADNPRIRIVIPLEREISPGQYRIFSKSFSETIGLPLDDCSYTPNTLMYLPQCPSVERAWVCRQDGEFLKVPPFIAVVDNPNDDDDLESVIRAQPLDIDPEMIGAYLSAYPSQGLGYDQWLIVGAAIHHQFEGSGDGYARWLAWSSTSEKHDAKLMPVKWKSFGNSKRVVTFASVIYLVNQTPAGSQIIKEKKIASVTNWLEKIDSCNDAYELEDVATKGVAFDRDLHTVDLAQISTALMRKFKVFGVALPVASVRKMISPKRQDRSNDGTKMEDWCEPYVWVKIDDKFANVITGELVSVSSFNADHGRNVKGSWLTPEGFQLSAAHVALQEIQIKVVSNRMYLPWAEQFFEYDGMQHLNSYRPSSVPSFRTEASWNLEEKNSIAMVKHHIDALLGKDAAKVCVEWMAFCVQNPGKKIHWSLLIKGMEGDGKSFIGNLMEAAMGIVNVGRVTTKILNTDFNGWAEGHCVCIVEELKLTGHNRHDVLNALKELHTNATITVHRKGVDSYQVANTQNYIAFTNFTDAIPVTDGDRRWYVVFSQFATNEDLEVAGMDVVYFNSLFGALENAQEALRGWLMSVDTSKFNPKGRAPVSLAKNLMASAAAHEEDQIAKEIIEEGCFGISKHVVSTAQLTSRFVMDFPEIDAPKSNSLVLMMNRLGFYKVTQRIKWKGEACRIWVKNPKHSTSNDVIRQLLDATIKESDR